VEREHRLTIDNNGGFAFRGKQIGPKSGPTQCWYVKHDGQDIFTFFWTNDCDKLHNPYGPAEVRMMRDGTIIQELYWINGRNFDEEEFNRVCTRYRTAPLCSCNL